MQEQDLCLSPTSRLGILLSLDCNALVKPVNHLETRGPAALQTWSHHSCKDCGKTYTTTRYLKDHMKCRLGFGEGLVKSVNRPLLQKHHCSTVMLRSQLMWFFKEFSCTKASLHSLQDNDQSTIVLLQAMTLKRGFAANRLGLIAPKRCSTARQDLCLTPTKEALLQWGTQTWSNLVRFPNPFVKWVGEPDLV